MNILHDIDKSRVTPDEFIAVIEIPMGSKNKYELDKETGMLYLDRVLYTSTHYPFNYGFIPLTHCDDGDPLDVFVVCSQSIDPLCLVKCKPIGCVTMLDGGKKDYKLLAVPVGDPMYNSIKDVSELPKHNVEELEHFLRVYKELEPNKLTVVDKMYSASFAKKAIRQAIKDYRAKYKK
ncbi:MAG: inorganic diphosphatase [Clostridia bacterium]|nr:inorganic diphosphatase [Clostridia bacterium]